ncbi:MAG TPA: hypothetical protein VGX37_09650, partial [Allosphingosinicella sp.]|nr:hypothetical protein [Allosphingosinicella sp.]
MTKAPAFAALAFVSLYVSPAAAADIRSIYTPLDVQRCTVLEQVEEGESVLWRCRGAFGIRLFVSSGDGRSDIDAGVANDEFETLPPFNRPGPRVEWRLRDGRPFAIIYRLRSVDSEHPGAGLFVATIGRTGAPGCTMAVVD